MLNGKTEQLELEEGDTMLDAMIDAGLEPSHDCRMGVCMTCPARLVRRTKFAIRSITMWHAACSTHVHMCNRRLTHEALTHMVHMVWLTCACMATAN